MSAPLEGLRVLDLATLYPAPLLAAMLGDLGADVVKVEPPGGDPLRRIGVVRDGTSAVWGLTGRNKRSVLVDLDTPQGVEVVQRLTGVADAVVVNQPRDVLERWKCTYEDIAARNPAAVVIAVSAFGGDGPYAWRPGNGTLAEAFAGVTHLIGEPDGPPVLPSVPLGDHLGAVTGLVGALAALYWRDARGGKGQLVDVSLVEAVLPLVGPALIGWSGGEPPTRSGSRVAGVAPRNVYRTADGRWVAVSGTTPSQVARVLVLIGADPDTSDPDGIDALVAAWTRGRDADAVLEALGDARIPAAAVNDLAHVVLDEHVRARGSVVEFDGERLPGPAPRLSETPARVSHTGPELGADTDDVLEDWLGA